MADITQNNQAALTGFMQAKAEIDAPLARIQEASSNHFDATVQRYLLST